MIVFFIIPYVMLFTILLPITYTFKDMLVFVQVNALIYLFYFIIITFILRAKKVPSKLLIISSAIIFVILLSKPHSLSNDIYRYIWDGMLLSNGYNPLLYKPQDTILQSFHNETIYKVLDWKGLYSPYPPFAQTIFSVSYLMYKFLGLFGARLVFAIPHLISGYLLYKFVDKRYSLIFLLNPLSLIEIVNSGHIDGYIVALLLSTLILYKKAQYNLAALFLGLAILTKVYPVLFLPVFLFDLARNREWKAIFTSGLVFVATIVLFYLPFLWGTIFPITRYGMIYDEQEYNASIFRYISYYFLDNTATARALAQSYAMKGFIVTTLLIYLPRFSYKLLILIGIVYLAFSPLVFPWYLLFFFPFVFFEAKEVKNNMIIYLFTFIQMLLVSIYLEPGNRPTRELMLNIEYGIILSIVIFYSIFSLKQNIKKTLAMPKL